MKPNRARGQARRPVALSKLPAVRSVLRLMKLTLGLAAVLVPAAWGGQQLMEPGRMPVRSIEIHGDLQRTDPGALRALALRKSADGLLHLDVHSMSEALASLPWVDSVSVRRIWPDRLRVTVSEHHAIARWGDGRWLNDRGEVFTAPVQQGPRGLPRFDAPEGLGSVVLQQFRAFERELTPRSLVIKRLLVDPRQSWKVTLSNGVDLDLGRDDLDARLGRFTLAWPKLLAAHADRISRIDLRYSHGLAVSWRSAGAAVNG